MLQEGTEKSAAPDQDRATVRNRAVALLARREHGRLELARKLEQKGFHISLVNEVLTELVEENLQSDIRYVEAFVYSRMTRGQGPLKIYAELAQNGIDETLVDDALKALAPDWESIASEVRRKRFKSSPPDEYAEKARQARFLSGRGFSSTTIWRVLGEGE